MIFKRLLKLLKKHWRIGQIIKTIVTLLCEEDYPRSDFPIVGPKKFLSIRNSYLKKILKFENDKYEYFSRIYNDPREFDTDITERDTYRTSVEISPGRLLKNCKFITKYRSMFQLARPNLSPIKYKVINKKVNSAFDLKFINNRFISF